MRKANQRTLLILILTFIGFLGLDVLLNYYKVDGLHYDLKTTETIQYLIMSGLVLLFVVPCILWTAKNVHAHYVKRKKQVPLKASWWFLFLTSLLTAYSFILFNLKYYYTAVIVVVLGILYFIVLKLFDRAFVRQAQKSKIDVNDELIMQLLLYLGGNANVNSVSFEFSRLKVELKDPAIVNLQAIQDLGATGIFVAGNKLQAFVGSDAERLERAIKQYLTRTF